MLMLSRSDQQNMADYSSRNRVSSIEDTESLFTETVAAGRDQVLNEERTDSRVMAFRLHLEARRQAISDVGGDPDLAQLYELNDVNMMQMFADVIDRVGPEEAKQHTADDRIIDAIMQQRELEQRFPETILSDAAIRATVVAELEEKRQANESILARGGGGAAFLGQARAFVADPFIVATAGFGGGAAVGRGLAANAVRAFATEASIAAATEVPIQAEVFKFKKEIDSPWTFYDAAVNTLQATVGAGGLRLAGSVAIDSAGLLAKQYRKLRGSARTAEGDAAADIIDRVVSHEAENPLRLDEETTFTEPHQRATDRAQAQLDAGEQVDVSDITRDLEPLRAADRILERTADDVIEVTPGEVNVDAKRFQFKSGGDDAGVTESLKDVETFDRTLAGQILVWEDTAGQRFVVDGHQRVGLAQRSLAAGQPPENVTLSAFVVREADGISAEDAMRIGSIKNLTQTTGSALDAAKVLRGIGPAGEAMLPPLPPNSAVLRQGRFLARLEDEPFNAVVNEVIPERQAAIIGELIAGQAEQLAAINGLKRMNPPNLVQARVMVESMRTAGFTKRVEGDLFGEREIAQSLIRERAQVVDATLKQSRKDRETFGRLVSRGTEIEDVGGNRLDQGANQQRVEESGQAIEIISRLATTKGPVSDAINEAAQRVAKGEKPGDVTDTILEAIKRRSAGGDSGGGASGTPGDPKLPGSDDVGPGSSAFNFEPSDRLTLPEQAVERRFMTKLDQTPWEDLKTEYADLLEAKGGKVLSVDAARELSPDYVTDRTNSAAVHEPASAFIKRLYAERLAEVPDADQVAEVVFTAGGTGAGKTSGLRFTKTADASQIIMDGNLAKFGSAKRKIDQALAAGKRVVINYVHRDPLEAFVNGAMPRAVKQEAEFGSGRTVPIRVHASTHSGAAETVKRLATEYADDARVDLTIVDNSNGKGKAALTTVDKLPEIEDTIVVERAMSALDEAEANGKISESIAAGFRGSEGPGRKDSPGVRRLDQQSRNRAAQAQKDRTTLPERIKAGRPDEGAATGYIDDADYDAVMRQYDVFDEEAGELATVTRVGVDERGETTTIEIGAREAMQELDDFDRSLRDIEVCAA